MVLPIISHRVFLLNIAWAFLNFFFLVTAINVLPKYFSPVLLIFFGFWDHFLFWYYLYFQWFFPLFSQRRTMFITDTNNKSMYGHIIVWFWHFCFWMFVIQLFWIEMCILNELSIKRTMVCTSSQFWYFY